MVSYKVSYNWKFIWIDAGEVTFTVSKSTFGEKSCLDIKAVGNTNPDYDLVFKARDRYESFVDSASLKPFRYMRETDDGGYKVYNDNFFNFDANKVYTYKDGTHVADEGLRDTTDIKSDTFDILSMIYYFRCIDYSKYKAKDTIPISIFLDSKVYNLNVHYLGKETIKSDLGKFNCIKFSPALVSGTIFSEDNQLLVWVTDDENKIPVLIETPIVVGTVKATLQEYSGLRNPVKAKVK